MPTPKILVYDIETAPITAHVWGTYDQNVGLNQIDRDWHLMSWAAKWYGEKEVMYQDQRDAKDIEDDKQILKSLWKLLDEADVVLTQNGKDFDNKKVNARFAIHGMKPPSPYNNIDTLKIARKKFGFTSNKLAYLTDKLCTKYKKLEHGKYPGFELWRACLKGDQAAWREMEKYNKHDVLSLEELYTKLAPWDSGAGLSVYHGENKCNCGSISLERRGYSYSKSGKYQRYICRDCGSWMKDPTTLVVGKNIKRGA